MTGVDRAWRAVGFVLLILGLGFRLDTSWQGLAWVLMVAGAALSGWGLWLLSQARRRAADAFVRAAGRE